MPFQSSLSGSSHAALHAIPACLALFAQDSAPRTQHSEPSPQHFACAACQDVGKSVSFKDDEFSNGGRMSGLREECSHES